MVAAAAGCCDIAGIDAAIATISNDAAAPRFPIFIRCTSQK
ncbi:hypothetical protein [Xanthomonas citri]|nr:hypothetical protein [Xanthomonas citri]